MGSMLFLLPKHRRLKAMTLTAENHRLNVTFLLIHEPTPHNQYTSVTTVLTTGL